MTIKRDAEWVYLEGWFNPDGKGVQIPFNEKLAHSHIHRLAPVVYVKRKL